MVCPESQKSEFQNYIDNVDIPLKVDLIEIPANDDWGTADTIRHIKNKIKVISLFFFIVPKPINIFSFIYINICLLFNIETNIYNRFLENGSNVFDENHASSLVHTEKFCSETMFRNIVQEQFVPIHYSSSN